MTSDQLEMMVLARRFNVFWWRVNLARIYLWRFGYRPFFEIPLADVEVDDDIPF